MIDFVRPNLTNHSHKMIPLWSPSQKCSRSKKNKNNNSKSSKTNHLKSPKRRNNQWIYWPCSWNKRERSLVSAKWKSMERNHILKRIKPPSNSECNATSNRHPHRTVTRNPFKLRTMMNYPPKPTLAELVWSENLMWLNKQLLLNEQHLSNKRRRV